MSRADERMTRDKRRDNESFREAIVEERGRDGEEGAGG